MPTRSSTPVYVSTGAQSTSCTECVRTEGKHQNIAFEHEMGEMLKCIVAAASSRRTDGSRCVVALFCGQENGWPPLVQRPSAPSRSMSECAFVRARLAILKALERLGWRLGAGLDRPRGLVLVDAADTDAAVGGCFWLCRIGAGQCFTTQLALTDRDVGGAFWAGRSRGASCVARLRPQSQCTSHGEATRRVRLGGDGAVVSWVRPSLTKKTGSGELSQFKANTALRQNRHY